jgi:hypothetical protein
MKKNKADLKQVWMCGGGTQSCAIAALIIKGAIPKPDFAVIADTGREAESTWSYLNVVIAPALLNAGIKIERVKASEYGRVGTDLFAKTEDLFIPAFTNQSGSTGKLSAFCNARWKIEPILKYLSSVHGLTRSKFRSWIGFSFDENRRYFRMMAGPEYQKGLIYFPLVEMRLLRHQSIELVKSMKWPEPPRSRCWMCPNQSDEEWRQLKSSSPIEFAEACKVEAEIQTRDPHAWLHSSCMPLSTVDFNQPPDLFNRSCDSGTCFL